MIADQPQFAASGALATYGSDRRRAHKRLAWYIDRVLNGVKPARPADRAADAVSSRYQHQNREGARADGAFEALVHRRRGDRLIFVMSPPGTERRFAATRSFGRYWSKSGHREALALSGVGANDPKRTFAPYQAARVKRYDASSWGWGGHAATGISRCSRWRGGNLAARRTCAASREPTLQWWIV